jgi:hypothetical protein
LSSAYRDRELDGVPVVDCPRDSPELTHPTVIAEDVVGGEAHLLQVLDALLVAGGGKDRVAGVLGEGDLRGRDLVGVVASGSQV